MLDSTRMSPAFCAWAAWAAKAGRLASAGTATSAPVAFTKPRLLIFFILSSPPVPLLPGNNEVAGCQGHDAAHSICFVDSSLTKFHHLNPMGSVFASGRRLE